MIPIPAARLLLLGLSALPAIARPLPAACGATPAPEPARVLAQDPAPRPEPRPEDPQERLDAWPALESPKAADQELARLRKARTEVMGEEAHAALVAMGAGVGEPLLKALAKERDAEARARIEAVLTEVTDARHTRLLAPSLALAKADAPRRFALRRIADLGDPGLGAEAEAALEAARARKEDELGEVAAERYLAALCAASCGSVQGFDLLLVAAEGEWGARGREMRVALERVRGEAATRRALEALGEEGRGPKSAALRMLAGCGTPLALPSVKELLDSSDNTLRIEAINACRGIVDGDPPIEKLSAFDAIELAKQWKGRV